MWLLPTRNRISTLKRFLDNAIKMGVSTPGMILVSENEYNLNKKEYNDVASNLPKDWKLHATFSCDGMGDKFREVWPQIKDEPWIGWLVDDVVPYTPNWDTEIIKGLNGKNIISCNDGFRAPHRICCAAYSGELLRSVGWLYPEGFWHTYVDDLWEYIGKATETWWINMDVLLKHEDAFQTGKIDETHQHSYSRNEQDKARFEQFMRSGEMDDTIKRVLKIL